jgi:hypothetical protein
MIESCRGLPNNASGDRARVNAAEMASPGPAHCASLPPLSATTAPNGPFRLVYRRTGRRGGARGLGREQGLSLGERAHAFLTGAAYLGDPGLRKPPFPPRNQGFPLPADPPSTFGRGAGRGYRGNLSAS